MRKIFVPMFLALTLFVSACGVVAPQPSAEEIAEIVAVEVNKSIVTAMAATPTLLPTEEEETVALTEEATPTPDSQQPTTVVGETVGKVLFSAIGLPASVEVKTPPQEYKNTLGYGSQLFMAEPGGRTADPAYPDPGCTLDRSCWYVNPDNQHDLTDLQGEGIDLNEDTYTMCSFSKGTFTFPGAEIKFHATPMQSHLFVMKGQAPGEGDRNTQVIVTDYDAGFVTCTNLPPQIAKISEDYVFQNFVNMFEKLCGTIDHCSSATLVFYDQETKGYAAFYQASPEAELVPVGTNLVFKE